MSVSLNGSDHGIVSDESIGVDGAAQQSQLGEESVKDIVTPSSLFSRLGTLASSGMEMAHRATSTCVDGAVRVALHVLPNLVDSSFKDANFGSGMDAVGIPPSSNQKPDPDPITTTHIASNEAALHVTAEVIHHGSDASHPDQKKLDNAISYINTSLNAIGKHISAEIGKEINGEYKSRDTGIQNGIQYIANFLKDRKIKSLNYTDMIELASYKENDIDKFNKFISTPNTNSENITNNNENKEFDHQFVSSALKKIVGRVTKQALDIAFPDGDKNSINKKSTGLDAYGLKELFNVLIAKHQPVQFNYENLHKLVDDYRKHSENHKNLTDAQKHRLDHLASFLGAAAAEKKATTPQKAAAHGLKALIKTAAAYRDQMIRAFPKHGISAGSQESQELEKVDYYVEKLKLINKKNYNDMQSLIIDVVAAIPTFGENTKKTAGKSWLSPNENNQIKPTAVEKGLGKWLGVQDVQKAKLAPATASSVKEVDAPKSAGKAAAPQQPNATSPTTGTDAPAGAASKPPIPATFDSVGEAIGQYRTTPGKVFTPGQALALDILAKTLESVGSFQPSASAAANSKKAQKKLKAQTQKEFTAHISKELESAYKKYGKPDPETQQQVMSIIARISSDSTLLSIIKDTLTRDNHDNLASAINCITKHIAQTLNAQGGVMSYEALGMDWLSTDPASSPGGNVSELHKHLDKWLEPKSSPARASGGGGSGGGDSGPSDTRRLLSWTLGADDDSGPGWKGVLKRLLKALLKLPVAAVGIVPTLLSDGARGRLGDLVDGKSSRRL